MTAYYNEHDKNAAAWLRELIKRNLIAPGEVDERSISDVAPADLVGYTQCHFFAGIGVWSHALRAAGWPDDRPVWTGSCPCQSFSAAGKGAGFADERHLWPHWFHLVRALRPRIVFGEQVEAAVKHGWLDLVHDDLEGEGYACGSAVFPACSVGAPHIRSRLYWVGDAEREGLQGRERCGPDLAEVGGRGEGAHGPARKPSASADRPTAGFWANAQWLPCRDGKARPVEPGLEPLVDGAPARVVRLRGYGNAIVAPAAQAFIEAYLSL